MSNTVKIIAIVGIIVFCLLFAVILIVVCTYIMRWRQKGINPNNAFPRNPKGGGLSDEQQRALNAGAILAGCNSDFCDSLQTSKAVAKKTISEFMVRDWEIQSGEDARNRLDDLKYRGHRQVNNFILKQASQLLAADTDAPVNPRSIYEQAGFSLLDKRILSDYPNEAAIAEKHIDLMDKLVQASAYEDIKEYEALFGDEDTFSICIQIYHRFYDECFVCSSRIANLKETLADLQEKGIVGANLTALEKTDAAAWDMGRMVNVARYSYDLGYISENQAWEYISFAGKESALHYADWAAFGNAYITGRALWGGKNLNLYQAIDTLEKLKKDKKSPWALVALR